MTGAEWMDAVAMNGLSPVENDDIFVENTKGTEKSLSNKIQTQCAQYRAHLSRYLRASGQKSAVLKMQTRRMLLRRRRKSLAFVLQFNAQELRYRVQKIYFSY